MAGIGHRGFFGRNKGGSGPANPCGTGASYPAGWRFLHDEISGGLGSWGNMLKVSGFNSFGAFLEDTSLNSTNLCYLDGGIDLAAADAFFSGDADVETIFDQLELNDLIDISSGDGYIKSVNDLNRGKTLKNVTIPEPILNGSLGALQNSDARTICMVVDYPSTPVVNEFFGPLLFPSSIGTDQWVWSGNNVSLIMRMSGPNQGYFYNGLRSAGTKLIIWTYNGTEPINRSGMNLYWNGNLETPDGIYNSGAPSTQTISGVAFGADTSSAFFKELDIFNFDFDSADVAAAKAIYEQKYTFS